MERAKLEEYKDAPGVALLNAFNNGHLTRTEYQVIQKFKKEPWDSIDEFLKSVKEESTQTVESTKMVESTKNVPSEDAKTVESAGIVESTKEEGSIIVESTKNVESTETVSPLTQSRRVLRTVSNEAAAAVRAGLFNVNIRANFTKVDNDIHTQLKPVQTTVEYSIYDTLYNRAIRWGRNYCRMGTQKLMECCNISDRRRLNRGIDGLIEKKHIQIINRNSAGTLYRVFLPQEIFNIETKTVLEMIPVSHEEGAESEESTKTVESTKKPPIIDPIDLSIDLSPDNIVTCFYRAIDQEDISDDEREKALGVIKKLQNTGRRKYNLEEIDFTAKWIVKNKTEPIRTFGILPSIMGQAMKAKKAHDRKQEAEAESEAAREEERRLQDEIEKVLEGMTEEERADLEKQAREDLSGVNQAFVTEMSVRGKMQEILKQRRELNLKKH